MSKVKKLFSNPRRFFEDAYKIRQKVIEENIGSILHRFNNRAQPLAYSIKNTHMSNKQIELEKFYNNLVGGSFYNLVENSENKLKNSLFNNEIVTKMILAMHKFNFHEHEIFKLNKVSLLRNSEIDTKIINSLSIKKKNIDGLVITNFIEHEADSMAFNSYRNSFIRIIKFIEKNISGHPERINLISKNNLLQLNSNAINPELCDFYLSNYMLYELLNRKDFNLNILHNKEDIYWWWLTYLLPTKKLTHHFIPSEVIAFFKELTFKHKELQIELPRFFHMAFEKNETYKQRYNLLDEVDFLGYLLDCYNQGFNNPINSIFIKEHVENILKQVVYDLDEDKYTLFDILYYVATTSDYYLDKLNSVNLNDSINHFKSLGGNSKLNITASALSLLDENESDNKALTLVGLHNSNTGLGANLKMISKAFKEIGIEHDIFDISTKKKYHMHVNNSRKLKNSCNIFVINADMIPAQIFNVNHTKGTVNIGFLLWELEDIPDTHKLALDFLDVIWVPTEFLKSIYEKYTNKPVLCVGKHISLISPTKAYIRDKKFRFYMNFDFHSNIERKNPLAAVKAFKIAFKKDDSVEFILKTTDILRDHPGNHKQQWERIIKEISGDERFIVKAGKIPFQELVNQINNIECIISPHRSEGFGYLPAHGFVLGKPVILTDYSGTSDFCKKESAYLVSWSKKQLDEGDFGESVKKGFWADINIDDMAEKMLEVYQNYPAAIQKAKIGQNYISTHYSLEKFTINCLNSLTELNVII